MRHLKTVLAVLGGATILALAANTVALASTGQALLLGKSNTAGTITAVTRSTEGTVLKLQSAKSFNAPLAVNGTGKVANLNADKVDGFDGGTRALKWTYAGGVAGGQKFFLNGLAPGTYLLSYEVYMGALSSADGVGVNCFFHQSTGGLAFGGESNSEEYAAFYPAMSGTALMTQPVGGNLGLQCNVSPGVTWTAAANQPVRITAIPIAGVTNKGALTNSKVAVRKTK